MFFFTVVFFSALCVKSLIGLKVRQFQHAGAVQKGEYPLNTSQILFANDALYVSLDGNDDMECGNELSPCRTISEVCAKGISPREVMVGNGDFVEAEGVVVSGTLSIAGSSSTYCSITKLANTSFTLFALSGSSAQLTLANLTLLLTNDATNYYFIAAPGTSQIVVVSGCVITMEGGGGEDRSLNNGKSFYIGSRSTLKIVSCVVCNITSMEYAFIYLGTENVTLNVTNSSFVNIMNSGSGGCFYGVSMLNIFLTQSIFVQCSGYAGGMGYVDDLRGDKSAIQSCSFLNSTSANGDGGALFVRNNNYGQRPLLTISNTSHIFCRSNLGDGGVLRLSEININLIDCSFTLCSAYSGGVTFIDYSNANITRCSFAQCNAGGGFGGAMSFADCIANITDSVYVGNTAPNGRGSDFNFAGTSEITFVKTYTDRVNRDVSMNCFLCPTTVLYYKTDYDSATCNGLFLLDSPIKECQKPCVGLAHSDISEETSAGTRNDTDTDNSTDANADNNTDTGTDTSPDACVKPDACPTGFVVFGKLCVTACMFSVPSTDDGSCVAPCVPDASLGYHLCALRDCAARVPNANAVTSGHFPCGSGNCYQQVSNGGTGLGTLNATCGVCDAAHFLASRETGVCILRKCEERISVQSLAFPCGTTDCYPQTNSDNTFNGKCGDKGGGAGGGAGGKKSRTALTVIIIGVVVMVVVVVVVVVVIVRVFVFPKKQNQTSLLSDQDSKQPVYIRDYLVGRQLGQGKFGVVNEVSKDGQLYVMKTFEKDNPACAGESLWVDECPKINSDFIVKSHKIIEEDGKAYVVMDLCENQNVRDYIRSLVKNDTGGAAITTERVMKIIIEMLLSLETLHRKGIIFCDIKPENIMIDKTGNIIIVDVGSMQTVEMQKFFGRSSFTPAYAPPEVKNSNLCTKESDMFSLGVLLYELCTLKLPYTNPCKANEGEHEMILKLNVPDARAEIAESLMDLDPSKRPSAFDLLQHDFVRECADHLGLLGYFPSTPPE